MFTNIRTYIYSKCYGNVWYFCINRQKYRTRKDFEFISNKLIIEQSNKETFNINNIIIGTFNISSQLSESDSDNWLEALLITEKHNRILNSDNYNVLTNHTLYPLDTYKNDYIKKELKSLIPFIDLIHINYQLLFAKNNKYLNLYKKQYNMDLLYLNNINFMETLGFPNYFIDYVYKAKLSNISNISEYIEDINISQKDKTIYLGFFNECNITFEKDISYNELKELYENKNIS